MSDIEAQSPDREGDAPRQQEGLYTGSHAPTAFFHCLFKAVTIVLFLLPTVAIESDVLRCILVIIFAAVDFWVVKNVSGRVLVGLRWWNKVTDDSDGEWIFESCPDRTVINACDSTLFWGVMGGTTVFWIVYFFVYLISFSWTWLPAIGVVILLQFTNLYGYAKCKKDWKKQGTAYMVQAARDNPEMAMQAVTTLGTAAASSPQQTGNSM